VVTAIDGASATVAAIDYIPQLTPVLLKRDDETVNSFSAPKGFGTTFDTNQLRVTTSDRTVSAGELYLLHNDEFVLTSSGTLPAGRVYLPVTAGANARRLTIGPDGGNATGVTSPLEGEGSGSAWYCLDGRKLGKAPTKKGVYIKDGRKVVVK